MGGSGSKVELSQAEKLKIFKLSEEKHKEGQTDPLGIMSGALQATIPAGFLWVTTQGTKGHTQDVDKIV